MAGSGRFGCGEFLYNEEKYSFLYFPRVEVVFFEKKLCFKLRTHAIKELDYDPKKRPSAFEFVFEIEQEHIKKIMLMMNVNEYVEGDDWEKIAKNKKNPQKITAVGQFYNLPVGVDFSENKNKNRHFTELICEHFKIKNIPELSRHTNISIETIRTQRKKKYKFSDVSEMSQLKYAKSFGMNVNQFQQLLSTLENKKTKT